MQVEDLLTENLVLVGPRDSDLKPGRPVRVAELVDLALVLPSRPHGLRLVVENAAAKARAKLTVRFEADSFRVLKDLVEGGLGYAVLPLSSIFREAREGRFRYAPLIEPNVTRRLVLAMSPDFGPSRATKMLVQLAREEIAGLVDAGDWEATINFPRQKAAG
jgi:DNA-binding transcriptional LysR family regulator